MAPYCKTREVGDAYTYLAHKRHTDFLICSVVGKWNDFTCDMFYAKLASRLCFPTRKRRVTIISDGNKQNLTGIKTHFPAGSVNYGIRKKLKQGDKIIGIISKVLIGNISRAEITINHVDGLCSKLRERISCFTRKARSFAKRKASLEGRLEIFSIQHNFIEKKHGETPAMREALRTRATCWSEVLHTRLTTSI